MVPIGAARAGVVSGGGAIPDSVTNRWPSVEGSGQTLNPSIGSVNVSLNFSTWATGAQYNGGAAPDYDGTDDFGESDSAIVNNQQETITFWIDNVPTDAAVPDAIAESGVNSDSAWRVFFDNGSDNIGYLHRDNTNQTNVIRDLTIPDASQQSVFVAIAIDGDSAEIWAYDSTATLQANATGSGARGIVESVLRFGVQGDNNHGDLTIDDVTLSSESVLTESEVQQIASVTGPNA